MRILVAEDQKDLNKVLVAKLSKEGYSVDNCFDGEEAMDFLDMATYDAVILDINMPKKDGLEVVADMRRAGNHAPVLFLTARDSIDDRVKGLDMGANDYLVKPFSFDELMARVRVLTRTTVTSNSPIYKIADLEMDTAKHVVTRGGQAINLSSKEYAFLEYLLKNQGKVLTRDSIENALWNFDYEGGTNAVDVYISYLRKKVDGGFDKKLIHTVRGVGYVIRED